MEKRCAAFWRQLDTYAIRLRLRWAVGQHVCGQPLRVCMLHLRFGRLFFIALPQQHPRTALPPATLLLFARVAPPSARAHQAW